MHRMEAFATARLACLYMLCPQGWRWRCALRRCSGCCIQPSLCLPKLQGSQCRACLAAPPPCPRNTQAASNIPTAHAGNTLGTLGLLFAVSESLSGSAFDAYAPDMPPSLGTLLAGAFAGAVYRSPRGAKAAAITAGVGTTAAAALLVLRRVFPGI
jgi:hypothetical protein